MCSVGSTSTVSPPGCVFSISTGWPSTLLGLTASPFVALPFLLFAGSVDLSPLLDFATSPLVALSFLLFGRFVDSPSLPGLAASPSVALSFFGFACSVGSASTKSPPECASSVSVGGSSTLLGLLPASTSAVCLAVLAFATFERGTTFSAFSAISPSKMSAVRLRDDVVVASETPLFATSVPVLALVEFAGGSSIGFLDFGGIVAIRWYC